MSKRKVDEIKTAEKILKIVFDALSGGQFNFHVAKLKGKTGEGNTEDVVETKLEALDTKRLLEVVTALEKIVNMKKKAGEELRTEQPESAGKIILPEIEYPDTCGGDES